MQVSSLEATRLSQLLGCLAAAFAALASGCNRQPINEVQILGTLQVFPENAPIPFVVDKVTLTDVTSTNTSAVSRFEIAGTFGKSLFAELERTRFETYARHPRLTQQLQLVEEAMPRASAELGHDVHKVLPPPKRLFRQVCVAGEACKLIGEVHLSRPGRFYAWNATQMTLTFDASSPAAGYSFHTSTGIWGAEGGFDGASPGKAARRYDRDDWRQSVSRASFVESLPSDAVLIDVEKPGFSSDPAAVATAVAKIGQLSEHIAKVRERSASEYQKRIDDFLVGGWSLRTAAAREQKSLVLDIARLDASVDARAVIYDESDPYRRQAYQPRESQIASTQDEVEGVLVNRRRLAFYPTGSFGDALLGTEMLLDVRDRDRPDAFVVEFGSDPAPKMIFGSASIALAPTTTRRRLLHYSFEYTSDDTTPFEHGKSWHGTLQGAGVNVPVVLTQYEESQGPQIGKHCLEIAGRRHTSYLIGDDGKTNAWPFALSPMDSIGSSRDPALPPSRAPFRSCIVDGVMLVVSEDGKYRMELKPGPVIAEWEKLDHVFERLAERELSGELTNRGKKRTVKIGLGVEKNGPFKAIKITLIGDASEQPQVLKMSLIGEPPMFIESRLQPEYRQNATPLLDGYSFNMSISPDRKHLYVCATSPGECSLIVALP